MSTALDMVLVGGEWRAVGAVSAEELEELERMHDAGDARAESRLELLRRGRPGDRALARVEPPPGFWHNCRDACGTTGCAGWGTRPGEVKLPVRRLLP